MLSTSPEVVRQAIAERIRSTVPDGYAHQAGDQWHESHIPLVPEWEPANRQHLAFSVDDRTVDDMNPSHSGPDDDPQISTPLIVRFCYEQRHDRRTEDWDGAAIAGRHLVSVLLEEWHDDVSLHSGGAGLIRRIPITGADAHWLVVEVRLRASYAMSLAFTDPE